MSVNVNCEVLSNSNRCSAAVTLTGLPISISLYSMHNQIQYKCKQNGGPNQYNQPIRCICECIFRVIHFCRDIVLNPVYVSFSS